jgi:uncharacterized LabA/DUF88 family protein
MNRLVILVDAGYLLRQCLDLVSDRKSHKREELLIDDPAKLVEAIVETSRCALNALPNRELLRIYWYDGVHSNGKTDQQKLLTKLPDLHFRAGTINGKGQQKGVDSLLVTDLIELATNHAIVDAAIITGDGDLAIGIELAQKRGVRVALVGVMDKTQGIQHNQSAEVTSIADRLGYISAEAIRAVAKYKPTSYAVGNSVEIPLSEGLLGLDRRLKIAPIEAEKVSPTRSQVDKIEQAVSTFIKNEKCTASACIAFGGKIKKEVDGKLLFAVYAGLSNGPLTEDQKRTTRDFFRKKLGNVTQRYD